jgi:hypothetical protein
MVFSGDQLIYGVKIPKAYARNCITNFINKINGKLIESSDSDDDDEISYEYEKNVNKLLKKEKLSVSICTEKCCYRKSEDTIFIGVELATNGIVFRFHREEFDTVEEYIDFYTRGIKNLSKNFHKKEKKYITDIRKIVDDEEIPIKFYSIPNDCSRCT